ncbi:MAG TPA: glycoside hydrolase family 32 protein [Rubrivivax sp.]|nr:glycoside hydrolase family 32 protein [Rubrivivax sp.]
MPPTDTWTAAEHWRPRYHFSPRRHWMNDPNGLVFHDGEYHLYFQHNPQGGQWGHISWGHAVSTDLVSWQELPVAIAASERVMAFSGSVVVDHANCGGFAPAGSAEPALVAFFTGFDPVTRIQSQHLAYSLDRGRSYTPYAGNPVIDIQSTEFRDPKVFWHAPTQRWVMLVVAALRQEMWLYTSGNLKDWTRASTFGPAGSAANNIWEVPDLFELPVHADDGSVTGTRWVLVISVNHGTPWGGSGVQYFVGDFDGTRFTAEASGTVAPLTAPAGELIADFEGERLPPGWQIEGPAFGTGPVGGMLEGQPIVSGHLGRGLMNSCHGGDRSTGTLKSPSFTLTKPFLCFQIAGSRGPLTRLELQVDGEVLRRAHGDGSTVLKWQSWDVSAWQGRQAVLHALDQASDGHLLLDHIVLCDAPVQPPPLTEITLWADQGRDFYAPITFANLPDDRVLWLGWMSNWDYARQVPTEPWRGQLSGVRELALAMTPRGPRLRQRPVREMQALLSPLAATQAFATDAIRAAQALADAALASRQLMARLELPLQGVCSPIGFEVFKGPDDAVRVGYDPAARTFFVDRRTASHAFPGQSERHDAARVLNAPQVELEVWLDGSTVELFADGGTVVISDLVFPRPQATGLALFHGPENPAITRMAVHAVRATMHASRP